MEAVREEYRSELLALLSCYIEVWWGEDEAWYVAKVLEIQAGEAGDDPDEIKHFLVYMVDHETEWIDLLGSADGGVIGGQHIWRPCAPPAVLWEDSNRRQMKQKAKRGRQVSSSSSLSSSCNSSKKRRLLQQLQQRDAQGRGRKFAADAVCNISFRSHAQTTSSQVPRVRFRLAYPADAPAPIPGAARLLASSKTAPSRCPPQPLLTMKQCRQLLAVSNLHRTARRSSPL